jgi:hypothetical protein
MSNPMSLPSDAWIPPARPRRSKRRQLIVLTIFLVLVVAFFGFVWLQTRHSPATAKAGDCVRQTGANSVRVVACDDPSATFKVVGRVDNKTQVEADLSACDPYTAQGAEQYYWSGEPGKTGYVLCLAKK